MKKFLLVGVSFLTFLLPGKVRAQTSTFSVEYDTVPVANVYYATSPVTTIVHDYITNHTTSGLVLDWHVIATNFPDDWLSGTALGICDNKICYQNGPYMGASMQLWNDTTHAANTQTSNAYPASTDSGAFNLSLNLSGTAETGTYFITVGIYVPGAISSSQTMTFWIDRLAPSVVPGMPSAETNVVLYPNPATDELNIVYDANADVKNIAVYNIIGKVMAVYKVNGPSANLNLENMPSGIYFVRLANSNGQVIATKKFTKQ